MKTFFKLYLIFSILLSPLMASSNEDNKENENPKNDHDVFFSTPTKKYIILLQVASVHTPTRNKLTPNKVKKFSHVDGTLNGPLINKKTIESILSENPPLFSPYFRAVVNPTRQEMKKLKERGVVTSIPALAYSNIQLLEPETEEQKQARKNKQLLDFSNLNNANLDDYRDILEKEAALWIPYWQYISSQIKLIDSDSRTSRIRPEELVDTAEMFPLKNYEYIELDTEIENTAVSIRVYYNLNFLNFDLQDDFAQTNEENMRKGRNPVATDGLTMEYHHLNLYNDSPLVLLSRSNHQGTTLKEVTKDTKATFHLSAKYYFRTDDSDIERSAFSQFTQRANKAIEKKHRHVIQINF